MGVRVAGKESKRKENGKSSHGSGSQGVSHSHKWPLQPTAGWIKEDNSLGDLELFNQYISSMLKYVIYVNDINVNQVPPLLSSPMAFPLPLSCLCISVCPTALIKVV